MNMTGFQDTNYGARTNRSYQSTDFSRSSKQMPVKASQASFSGHATAYLKLGYLYADVDLVNGQELYMNYDESSTEDDPVILAEGIDIHGNAFQTKIHLNGIDVNHASLVEMAALNVHLAEQGDQAVKDHVSFPLLTLGNRYDITQKLDFEQYFSNITGKYQAAGFDEEANFYKEEMERYLFFRNTERFRVNTEEEHVLFQSKTEKTGVFSNKTLAELAGYKLDHEIDWESDGTGSLTKEQILYLKGKYDVEDLTEAVRTFYEKEREYNKKMADIFRQLQRGTSKAADSSGKKQS